MDTLAPVLTIVGHPDPSRVGEQAWLDEDPVVRLSRSELAFGEHSRPLDDPFLSRRPIVLRPVAGGGASVDARDSGTTVSVDGRLFDLVSFGASELVSGVILNLSGRVALSLALRPRPPAAPSLGLVGSSDAIARHRLRLRALSEQAGPVLFVGEPGSGRETAARQLAGGPVVRLDLTQRDVAELESAALDASIQAALQTAEASGQPAFGVMLSGLDEVPTTAVRAVLGLQTGVRLFAAAGWVADTWDIEGWSVCPVPSLRERREDIAILFHHFLDVALHPDDRARILDDRSDAEDVAIPPELVERLMRHSWPGNLAELRQVVGEVVLRSRAADRLHWKLVLELPTSRLAFTPPDNPRFRSESEVDDDELVDVLASVDGDEKVAARVLGVSRGTLARLISRHPDL